MSIKQAPVMQKLFPLINTQCFTLVIPFRNVPIKIFNDTDTLENWAMSS